MAPLPETEVKTITLTIDDQEVTVPAGTTVLEAARSVGIDIPTLCHDPRLEPFGACRLCLVEVEGGRAPMPSCALKAGEAMVVKTRTERIMRLRKFVIELLLSNHPLDCPVCEAAGDCRLQDYAYEYGVAVSPWGWTPHEYPTRDDHPNIARDPNRCILCGRCVRICRDVMGIGCWGFRSRGYDTIIDTPYNMPLQAVDCVSCGQCVSACPVGALNMKRSRFAARNWQTEKTITTCGYCAVGCEMEVQTFRGKVVRVKAPFSQGVNEGNLCVKGRFGIDYVNSDERLTAPLVRGEDGLLKPADWETALARVAEGLKKAKAGGGKAVGVIASTRCTNEENYLLQKLARTVLGTANIDSGARLNQAAALATLRPMLGYPAMTNSIADLDKADVLLVVGSNTTEEHPVLALRIVKALREGKTLIVVDPRCTALAKRASIHLPVKPGTDGALLKGMLRHIVDTGLADKDFVAQSTEGYDELVSSLDLTPEAAAGIAGVEAADLKSAAEAYAQAAAAGIVYSAGVTQQAKGAAIVRALVDLALLTGNIGRLGTGVNSLSGGANAQGACDMGCLPDFLPGFRALDDTDGVKAVEAAMGAKVADKKSGKTVDEMLQAVAAGEIKGLYVVGENLSTSQPDRDAVVSALQGVEFLVVQDLFFSETARYADVVLPACTIVERDGTFTNTERRVQRIRGALEPRGDARPDWMITRDVANALGAGWSYASAEDVFAEIGKVIPEYAGFSYERLEEQGLQWPCLSSEDAGTPVLYAEGFPGGKAVLAPVEYQEPSETASGEFPFLLTTGIEREHFGTGVRTRQATGLTGLVGGGRLEMSAADVAKLGLADGDTIKVTSRYGSIEPLVVVGDSVPEGLVFMPQHYAEAPAAWLFGGEADAVTGVPAMKLVAVRIEKA
ncbi:MAG: formate dehydrogenase subunit alpha [Gaiellales bacterium]|nr:formate dehydrogenase subunit alpha [Gaiellales bacterium]